MESQICVEMLSYFVGCVFQTSNYIHPLCIYLLFFYSFIVCFCQVQSPMAMGTLKGPIWFGFLLCNANHIIGLFAKLLRDLDKPSVYFFCAYFYGCGTTPLYETMLQGKKICISSLSEPSSKPIFRKPLPPTFHVQLDNWTKDNKCRYMFCFWSLLVAKGIFKEVFVSFLIVRHTLDYIDASFGRWSMKFYEEDFSTILFFMKLYMNLNNMHVISYMIEEVPNFRAFMKPYMLKEMDRLVGHTKTQ